MSKEKRDVTAHRSNEELLRRGKGGESEEFLSPSSCWLMVTLLWVALKKCISFGAEEVDKCWISNAVLPLHTLRFQALYSSLLSRFADHICLICARAALCNELQLLCSMTITCLVLNVLFQAA